MVFLDYFLLLLSKINQLYFKQLPNCSFPPQHLDSHILTSYFLSSFCHNLQIISDLIFSKSLLTLLTKGHFKNATQPYYGPVNFLNGLPLSLLLAFDYFVQKSKPNTFRLSIALQINPLALILLHPQFHSELLYNSNFLVSLPFDLLLPLCSPDYSWLISFEVKMSFQFCYYHHINLG